MVYYENKKEAGNFDLVAVNGREIVAIKVKSTLTVEKVKKFIEALKRFKEYFPEYKDKIVYGGVVYLCEPPIERSVASNGSKKFLVSLFNFVRMLPGRHLTI